MSTEKQDKIYVGTGKVFGDYGQIGITVFLDDIPEEHTFKIGDKKAVKLNISQRRTPTEKSTHSVILNTWKPDGSKSAPQQTGQPQVNVQEPEPMGSLNMNTNEEVPF